MLEFGSQKLAKQPFQHLTIFFLVLSADSADKLTLEMILLANCCELAHDPLRTNGTGT